MNKIEIHKTLCDQLNDIYSRKNADYGDSFAKVRKEVRLLAYIPHVP